MDAGAETPFEPHLAPFAGFEVAAMTDRTAYGPGQVVRITVTATNGADRRVEHHYPGWHRFSCTVRDAYHRVVAGEGTEERLLDDAGFTDRWLPGQMVIFPVYWAQHEGPLVPARADEPPGPRAEPGRYRIRVTWLGREPRSSAELPDVFTPWFELV